VRWVNLQDRGYDILTGGVKINISKSFHELRVLRDSSMIFK
jgi:hypothetical protein